tara:strand:+ start:243 stop:563 length:321 start_codon:yes stop_codon:yes gene_type:complete
MECRILNFLLESPALTTYREQPSVDFRGYKHARLTFKAGVGLPTELRFGSNESLVKSSTKGSLYTIPIANIGGQNLNLDGLQDVLYFWVGSDSVYVSVMMWGAYDE